MAHFPKPFFRPARGLWYVQLRGKQHNLGPDRDEALRRYHELMSRPEEEPVAGDAVLAVIERFLEWCQTHRPDSYTWYLQRLRQFARAVPRTLTVRELRPFHVQEWVDAHPDWSPSHKRGSTIAVQRAFRWAEKMGHIDKSPVRHVEKPEQGKREQIISPEDYAQILARYEGDPFADLLEFSWQTGARPQETVIAEVRHLDLGGERLIFPPEEAKGKKRYRVVYLNDAALQIVRRLALEHPEGPLFRNSDGEPWTAWAVNCRFGRLQASVGRRLMQERGIVVDAEAVKELAARLPREHTVRGRRVAKSERELLAEARKKLTAKEAAKLGGRFCLYSFRHTFANRLLKAGVDALTVATLLGHADGTMLAKVYSHLNQSTDYLRDALKKAGGGAGQS
jgi:integrase